MSTEVSSEDNIVEVLIFHWDGTWNHSFIYIPPTVYDPKKLKTGHFYNIEEKITLSKSTITKVKDIYYDIENLRTTLLSLALAGESSLRHERPMLTLKYFSTIVDILRAPDIDFEI